MGPACHGLHAAGCNSTQRGSYNRRMPRKRRLRLDTKGRIQIPRRILAKARLAPGDLVDVESVFGGLLLHGRAPPGLRWEQGILVIEGEPSEEFEAELRRMKQEDLDREMRRCWRT